MQTICKKKQANTTKTRKKQHLFCILFANCLHFLQISQCFLYFSSIPRGPARKLQICEKKCKKKMSFQDMLQIQREKNAEKIQIQNAK